MKTPGFAVCPVNVSPAVASVAATVIVGGNTSLSAMLTVAVFAVPRVYPVPIAKVKIAVSFVSNRISSIGAIFTNAVADPAAKVALPVRLG